MANSQNHPSKLFNESTAEKATVDSTSYRHVSQVPSRQTIDSMSQVPPGQTMSKRFVNLRRASIASLLLAPIIAIPPTTRVLVDRAASTLANFATTNLEHAFAWRSVRSPQQAEDALPEQAPQPTNNTSDNSDAVTTRSPQPGKNQRRGIVVRADAVVRAVRSGGRPSSLPAPASDQHPAGLSLVGVSHFGTGMQDGDILTRVGGTPATSEGTVIGVVAGAIGQGAKVITGVVWRGDQRIDVAVEIPSAEAFAKPLGSKSVAK